MLSSASLAAAAVYLWFRPRPLWRCFDRHVGFRPRLNVLAALMAACSGFLLLPGWLKIASGALALIAYLGVEHLSRLDDGDRRVRIRQQVPLLIDLTNASLMSGRPVEHAIALAAQAIGGDIEQELVSYLNQAAVDPLLAADRLSSHQDLALLGRSIVRASQSGSSIVSVLGQAAIEARRDAHSEAKKRARAVEIASAGPLAACFLPAFILIAIVPLIASGFLD